MLTFLQEKMAASLQHTPESILALANKAPLGPDNQVALQIQEVLTILVLPVYMYRPRLLAALCFLSVSITTRQGPSVQGAYPAMVRNFQVCRMQCADMTRCLALICLRLEEEKI